MIKITKPGQKVFHGFCKWCGCEFTYEISDLKLSATSYKVSCPTCGEAYYHSYMVQDPTIPGGIGYQWPSDSTDPCAGCVWRSNLESGAYIGDTPCAWCNKNPFNRITCEQPSLKDYTTPCINQLDANLNTSSASDDVEAYNKTDNKEDITQGTVMSTIFNACREGYPDDHAVGKGLTSEHIVGDSSACYCLSSRNSGSVESH